MTNNNYLRGVKLPMSINDKNIPDLIQSVLDKNKGFIAVSQLVKIFSPDVRDTLGIKSNSPANVIVKKLEPMLEDRFIIIKKGRTQYILTPCDPEDMVLGELSETKAVTQKQIARTLKPLLAADVAAILTELVNSGRVRIVFDAILPAKLFLVKSGNGQRKINSETQTVKPEECTQGAFRAAYDELHKFREFVRICDLRRKLNWPREVFDEMVRKLRDNRTIQLFRADEAMMTRDELQDCFIDDRNFIMGIMTWNGR